MVSRGSPTLRSILWQSSPRVHAAAVVLVCLWSAAAWVIAGAETRRRGSLLIETERQQAQRSAEVVSLGLRRTLAHISNISATIATESDVVAALQRFGPAAMPSPLPFADRQRAWRTDPGLGALSRRLASIVAIDTIGISGCWVMNAAGDTIAAGDLPGIVDYVGINYADRSYFAAAKRLETGREYGIGRLTGVPLLFFVSPVVVGGQFIGAVGVRTTVSSLIDFLEPGMFATDRNGVVILAQDAGLMMRVLPDSPIDQIPDSLRQLRYKRLSFDRLRIDPAAAHGPADLIHWQGSPATSVMAAERDSGGILAVYAVRPVPGIDALRTDRVVLASLLSLIGALVLVPVLGLLVYLRARSQHTLELQALNQRLSHQARTDALTGCFNRRHFFERLDAERERARRYRQPFSVLALDLDHFKAINDRHGHPAGDRVLCHVVAIVTASIRPTDILGRMGGEEFSILLPETPIDAALRLAERIRAAMEASAVPLEPDAVTVTVSIGAAQWHGDGDTVESLLARADAALYEAKSSGRNRLCAEPSADPTP